VGSNDESLEVYGRQAINLIHFCWPSPSKELFLWWGSSFKGCEFNISISRAKKLHKVNNVKLRKISDLWN
jgi:hypothetical protein